MLPTTDVLIVGGGPAGLAAAIALKQRGLDAVVVEALAPGIQKACGEGLMPGALEALQGLGVEFAPSEGFSFRGIRFINARDRATADFPSGTGLGVQRSHLHHRLAERAAQAGARLHWRSHFKLDSRGSASIDGQTIGFRWLLGADGQASAVRRWAGLGRTRQESLRFGFRRYYQIEPWSEHVEVFWCAGGQIYITPVAHDCLCVVFMSHDPHCDVDALLASAPELQARLENAPMLLTQRAAVSATRKLRRVADATIALIGDASGSADATTGEGLSMSFRQAQALAAALANGSTEGYQAAHERIGTLPHTMGALMLMMDRWPMLERRAIRTLAARPHLFQELMAVHIGAQSPVSFALHRGPQLGWNLLTA